MKLDLLFKKILRILTYNGDGDGDISHGDGARMHGDGDNVTGIGL